MTREEAINEIKSWAIPSEKGREVLETLFPELAESEDERIRKVLVDMVKRETGFTGFPSQGQVLAYLEKQKEQNGEDEECTDFTIYHPFKNGKGKYECIPYSFYGSLTSFSEDKDLIDFLRTCFYTKEECNEWIEKQKEWKPAEWNERDEKWFDYFERLLEFGYNKDPHHLGKLCIEGKMWLKSLRPSWKPSKEQMKALEDAFRKNGSDEYRKTINSLYQDLKKL